MLLVGHTVAGGWQCDVFKYRLAPALSLLFMRGSRLLRLGNGLYLRTLRGDGGPPPCKGGRVLRLQASCTSSTHPRGVHWKVVLRGPVAEQVTAPRLGISARAYICVLSLMMSGEHGSLERRLRDDAVFQLVWLMLLIPCAVHRCSRTRWDFENTRAAAPEI